jgi:hypothetical protein
MLYNKLLSLIETNSLKMAEKWRDGIKTSDFSKTYQKLDDQELLNRSKDVYDNLGKWLDRDTTIQQIEKNYLDVGKKRYHEGFPLCEVHFALHSTKNVLWNHILSEGILTNALEIFQAMDLIVRVYNFFDIATIFIIRGYMEELYAQLGKTSSLDPEELKKTLHLGSFHSTYASEMY